MVHHHIASRDHYDFRLELNGVMISFAIPKGPSLNPTDKRLAVQVEDHQLDFNNFEGVIPEGQYGAGTVMIWDEGTWEPLTNAQEGLAKGRLKFVLHGLRLKGEWTLVHLKPLDKNNWLLIKEKDVFALDEAGIDKFITSVKTGRTMDEITLAK